MSEARRVLRSSSFVVCALAWVAPLRARASEEAIRFQYTAPAECPDAESFTARVRLRTPRGRLAEAGELARTFTLELTPDAQGFLGSIEFLDDGGALVSRRLHGEQCDAVVNSLALITALALDATLRQDEVPPPPPEKAPPPVIAPARTSAAAPKMSSPRRPAPLRAFQGARVGLRGGYDGAVHAAEIALLGQLDWRSGFALRLTAHYAWDDFSVDEGRSARLRLQGVETSACPWRFGIDAFSVAPCADLDLGTLHAAGVPSAKLTSAGADTILWASVGGELRVAWEPRAPFWIELRGAVGFPLVATHQFTFENPHKLVYEVPPVSGAADLALGVRFW